MEDRKLRTGKIKGSKLEKPFLPFLTSLTFLTFLIFVLTLTFAFAVNETHLDKAKLPRGCASCHKGHGKRATVMLESAKDELCFNCHGPARKGVPGEAKTDISTVMLKKSVHPITQTAQYHVIGETLPEMSPATPRHVSCYDCHNMHLSTKDKAFKGVRGYSGKGAKIKRSENEYEVCYLCHADSANLPSKASNIAPKFDRNNASFHPVEAMGKNRSVPSLRSPLSTSSAITCSDCHGNDDKFGPKGPHGSNYANLLKANYTVESGPESPFAYELCYDCHTRSSILNDDSFKSHKRHVLYANIPCFSCHDAHGSKSYDNLMNFDKNKVLPNSMGQLLYTKSIPGKPRCFLSCHIGAMNYEHKVNAGKYCVNANCPPGW
ncbi:MAG: cytochrome c3 family protein [Nitrospirae bacterium]|nr:cytochrome c3 family protein [Nitrospirota bacterium]